MTWVVLYNTLPLRFEADGCAHRTYEFFESESEAQARYDTLSQQESRVPTKRPYHPADEPRRQESR